MITCRPFSQDDQPACLKLFDSNVPDYFAPNERPDYERFLESAPAYYRVCHSDEGIVAAYGLSVDPHTRHGRIRWIMTQAAERGSGIGSYMMREVLKQAAAQDVEVIEIAASQKSAPYFARYGAIERWRTEGGWGAGLDRVEMAIIMSTKA